MRKLLPPPKSIPVGAERVNPTRTAIDDLGDPACEIFDTAFLGATLPGMAERTITVGGFGKTYAVTGWRLGYVCAMEPFAGAVHTVHDFTTICAPVPLQAAAVAALNLPESYYENLTREFTERRALIMPALEALHFKTHMPEGSYYAMVDFSAWNFDGDDYAFARWMPAHLGVAVVPGSCFYGTPGLGKSTVRFAFAKKLETLNAAVDRLRVWRDKH